MLFADYRRLFRRRHLRHISMFFELPLFHAARVMLHSACYADYWLADYAPFYATLFATLRYAIYRCCAYAADTASAMRLIFTPPFATLPRHGQGHAMLRFRMPCCRR